VPTASDPLHIPEAGEYLTAAGVARLLGIAPGSVNTARRRGSLVAAVVDGPFVLYRREDVEAYRLYRDEWLASIGREVPTPYRRSYSAG
jgi:hypothetical protein